MGFALLWAAVTAIDKPLMCLWPSFIPVDFSLEINKSGCLLLLLNGFLLEKAERLGNSNSSGNCSNNSRCFSRRWGDLGRGKVNAEGSDCDHKKGQKRKWLGFFQAPYFFAKTLSCDCQSLLTVTVCSSLCRQGKRRPVTGAIIKGNRKQHIFSKSFCLWGFLTSCTMVYEKKWFTSPF